MNQLLLGASLPFTLALAVYLARRCRATAAMLILTPAAMALTALWAVAPDLPRLVGSYALYDRLAYDPRCNIFLWHYSIDMAETDSPWYGAGVVLLLAALIMTAWRELRLAERVDGRDIGRQD